MGEDHAAIMKLQVQATALQRKTEAETQRLSELDALRRQVERKIREQRSDKTRVRSGGVYASKTTTLRTTKIHGQLETRRAGLNRKAAAFDLENASVRAAVNARRRKMGLFDKVYERLTKELRQVDRDKQALMNVSNESYMQHEDAKRQTARLETINAREQEDCDRLCREAEAMIARQNEAREFVDSVTKKRLEAEKAAENAEAIAQLEGDSGGGGGGEGKEQPEESQEHVLKARLRDLKRGAAAQEAHIRAVDMQLLSAEQAFTRLRKVSGLQSTAAVVAAFVANEDENFSLFNFIQQTNDESSRQAEVRSDSALVFLLLVCVLPFCSHPFFRLSVRVVLCSLLTISSLSSSSLSSLWTLGRRWKSSKKKWPGSSARKRPRASTPTLSLTPSSPNGPTRRTESTS